MTLVEGGGNCRRLNLIGGSGPWECILGDYVLFLAPFSLSLSAFLLSWHEQLFSTKPFCNDFLSHLGSKEMEPAGHGMKPCAKINFLL